MKLKLQDGKCLWNRMVTSQSFTVVVFKGVSEFDIFY